MNYLLDDWSLSGSGSSGGSSGGSSFGATASNWFELALGAYVEVEKAKAGAQGPFSPPYQPVTYTTQPNAVPFDLKNLVAGVQQSTGIPSGLVVAGMLALVGLVAYRLIK